MSKTARQSIALFLIVAVLSVLAWRLWPDGRRARQQQRNDDLVDAVLHNRQADAARLLDEGADPNARMQPDGFSDKAATYYFDVSNRVRKPTAWQHLTYEPRWSVLEIAAMHGKTDTVRLLLSKGAAVGYLDTDGYTALSTLERYKGQMTPAAWNASRYPRVFALLKAAASRRKARP